MGARRTMTTAAGPHQNIYRGLLRLYPADYRARFGDQMVQLFSDQLRDQGPLQSWLRAMGDLSSSALSEHLRRNRTVAHSMTLAPTPLSRLLGVLGVIGGAFLLIAFVGITIGPDLFNLRLAMFNIGAIAVVIAVHQRQARSGRALALAGALPAIVANVAYLVLIVALVNQPGELGPGRFGALIAPVATAMWLSDVWFGLVALRLRAVSRLASLALVIGSLFALVGQDWIGIVHAGSVIETAVLAGIAVHGLAWMALGLDVALRRRPAATQP